MKQNTWCQQNAGVRTLCFRSNLMKKGVLFTAIAYAGVWLLVGAYWLCGQTTESPLWIVIATLCMMMPLILMGHNFPDHPVIGVFVMTIACICLAPIVQFIRLKSGSVVAAAIFHGSFNAFGTFIPLFFEHTDDLLSGPMGLAGIVTSIVGLGILHLTDRRILSSTI